MQQRFFEASTYNQSVNGAVSSYFKTTDLVRVKLAKGTFDKAATQVWHDEVYQVASVKGTRVKLKTYLAGELVERAVKPNELLLSKQPVTNEPAAVIQKANKASKQDRRLRKEGLR
eukprot:GHRR01002855.1.p2 GENE.GHRR01002855.1~~GHRR01002855.1.p2  ORF type:complete len:127 (-),score=32.03 GHRR01002855.1:1710-2057(-)